MCAAAARLSGADGLTANHNTFARRHVIAELAGEFSQGASVGQLERATDAYVGHDSVVFLGRDGAECRYTTRALLACERAIVESARRRVQEGTAVLSSGLTQAALQRAGGELNDEQSATARTLAASGNGVDAMQALAGTGKTRVLGALASCYRQAGYGVVGIAPTAEQPESSVRR